jgi:hypothetical protein
MHKHTTQPKCHTLRSKCTDSDEQIDQSHGKLLTWRPHYHSHKSQLADGDKHLPTCRQQYSVLQKAIFRTEVVSLQFS